MNIAHTVWVNIQKFEESSTAKLTILLFQQPNLFLENINVEE
jgi:hypothetical protein